MKPYNGILLRIRVHTDHQMSLNLNTLFKYSALECMAEFLDILENVISTFHSSSGSTNCRRFYNVVLFRINLPQFTTVAIWNTIISHQMSLVDTLPPPIHLSKTFFFISLRNFNQ